MKKLALFAGVFMLSGLAIIAMAGTQYDWANGNGGKFITPDPTNIQVGQALLIGSTIYPEVRPSSTTALGIASFTLAQLNASIPTIAGQIAYCSNCTNTILVVSSGTTTAGSWQGVFLSTGGGVTGKTPAT